MKEIYVKGARKNNLKGIDLRLPKNKIIAVTGVSGSGKSTLVFDIINNEGCTCYLDAVSNELSNTIKERNVDYIKGLTPSVALRQIRYNNNNPRSTIATLTDIATYLRILFSDKGMKVCHKCGEIINQRVDVCTKCGTIQPVFSGAIFSYNTKEGMCPVCNGMGMMIDFSEDKIISRPDLPVQEQPWGKDKGTIFKYTSLFFEALADEYGYDFNLPFKNLSHMQKNILLYGTGEKKIRYHDKKKGSVMSYVYPGIIPHLRKAYQTNKDHSRIKSIEKYMRNSICLNCGGLRLRPEALNIKYGGLDVAEWFKTEIGDLYQICYTLRKEMKSDYQIEEVTYFAINEIYKKLYFLNQFGLEYLTLGRGINTLSGGELQHVRLANYMGINLGGLIYVLDEPSAGIHERDKEAIVNAMKSLRKDDNTVIVVDHNESIIRGADFLVDLGPGGGDDGGRVCFAGNIDECVTGSSLTCSYLNGVRSIDILKREKRKKSRQWLSLEHAGMNNIKDISVSLPLQEFVVITGVSGSGKSTLIDDILYSELMKKTKRSEIEKNYTAILKGWESINEVILIDQSPIGRISRSNLATYIGVFDEIRKLYASLPEAKEREITWNKLSFNANGGRCDVCGGMGQVERNVYFVHEVLVQCPECGGKRYKKEILSLKYQGMDISQVLDMTVNQAYHLFAEVPKIRKTLQILDEVGLGYMKLGQVSTSFSGGEAQRIKLTKHLALSRMKNTLFIFDEPTIGLHFEDINHLLNLFFKLIDQGNSIICIEHNMNVINAADYIVDMGPEGGKRGGKIVCKGTPEDVAKCAESYTGKALKRWRETRNRQRCE